MKAAVVAALLLGAAPAKAQHWSRSWAVAPQAPMAAKPIPDLRDRTVRQVVRLSNGGKRLRIRLSNEMSEAALRVGAVRIAIAGADGRIVAGTSRAVTFGGEPGARLSGHAPLVSDPVAMTVEPLQRLAISIHLPEGASAPTIHGHAAATAYIGVGDQTGATAMTAPTRFGQRAILAGVDVESARPARTIVAFGDSITDGARATNDVDTRYPDVLAARLQRAGMRGVGVANLGIGGNRLLTDGTGLSALARFDRDVLSVPGVSHVIILEGVNDIGMAARDGQPLPSADAIIDAYRQLIARAHASGVEVILATILPYKGAGYWTPAGEAVRAEVNAWIRANREADGVADFARAVADPADPLRIAKAYDGGDALHPNDAGFAAMAAAVDLLTLR